MELIKPGRQFDFMSKRWLFMGISAVLLLASLVALIKPGPKFGTDFKGGTEVEVAFLAPVDAGELRSTVASLGFDAPDVVSVTDPANPNRFLIRVQEVSVLTEAQKTAIRRALCVVPDGQPTPTDCAEGAAASELKFSQGGDKITARFEAKPNLDAVQAAIAKLEGVKLRKGDKAVALVNEREHKVDVHLQSRGDQILDGLREKMGVDKVPEQALRIEWIGPKAGERLRDAAIRSLVIALFFIMAYVAFRFDLRFAPGGILALAHDVFIALGAMVITGREITLSTVAALLTIVGYSITDTVVVYDRIRENLAKHRTLTFPEIINLSISEMLGRTIIVSGVTALSMICFLIWGTGVIKDFAFALLVGIVVGTYSSIYIAAPFTEWVDRRFFGATAGQRKKPARPARQRAETTPA